MKKIISILIILIVTLGILGSCGKDDEKKITIAASDVPHKEIIDNSIKPQLEKKGYTVKVVVFDDYVQFNSRLEKGEIDANYFQHKPFLESEIKENGYKLTSIAEVHLEPLAAYSQSIKKLSELKKGDTIAVPNDESNQSRALKLLADNDVLTLKEKGDNTSYTIDDIDSNPKDLKIIAFDANILPAQLGEPKIALGIINSNYAIGAGLNPQKDGVVVEETEGNPYNNIIVVRTEDVDKQWAKDLKEAATSEETTNYVKTLEKDGVFPVN